MEHLQVRLTEAEEAFEKEKAFFQRKRKALEEEETVVYKKHATILKMLRREVKAASINDRSTEALCACRNLHKRWQKKKGVLIFCFPEKGGTAFDIVSSWKRAFSLQNGGIDLDVTVLTDESWTPSPIYPDSFGCDTDQMFDNLPIKVTGIDVTNLWEHLPLKHPRNVAGIYILDQGKMIQDHDYVDQIPVHWYDLSLSLRAEIRADYASCESHKGQAEWSSLHKIVMFV